MRFARLVAMGLLVFSAGALGAQKAPATKAAPTAKDTMKTMKKDVSRKKAQAKAAKASGDTTKAKELKKAAKKEAKQLKAMKKSQPDKGATAPAAPAKKP